MTLPNALFDAAGLFVAAINGVWCWWSVGDVGDLTWLVCFVLGICMAVALCFYANADHFFWAAHTAFLKLDCKVEVGVGLGAEMWVEICAFGCGRILSFRKGIRHLSYTGAEAGHYVSKYDGYTNIPENNEDEEEVVAVMCSCARVSSGGEWWWVMW
ncbi:hypothetical protein Tco_0010610 [Tanacetum coccineum]